MVVALSLFHAYQFTPLEYVKDSHIEYVHRMAELYKRAPVQTDDLPLAPEIPLLLPELESAFRFNFVTVVAAHTTSAPLPRGIWAYCEDEKMSLRAIVSELRDVLTWRHRIRARDVEPLQRLSYLLQPLSHRAPPGLFGPDMVPFRFRGLGPVNNAARHTVLGSRRVGPGLKIRPSHPHQPPLRLSARRIMISTWR